MDNFVRARTEDQFNIRREMILNACDEIYSRDGFLGVTFNTVAAKTSFTRPALYNYYKSREDMLMDLVIREVKCWEISVKEAFAGDNKLTREEYCRNIATVAEKHEKLLMLLNDLYLIERGCDSEKIVEYKKSAYQVFDFIGNCLRRVFPDLTDEQISQFQDTHCLLACGLYQYTHMNQRQVYAFKQANPGKQSPSLKKMLYDSLMFTTSIFERQ